LLRNDSAIAYGDDKTCLVTTKYFLGIVLEAVFEELHSGKSIDLIKLFCRMVNPISKLAKKLACGCLY